MKFNLADNFSLKNTLECGQCFRWNEDSDGSFCGVVGKKYARLTQCGKELFVEEFGGRSSACFWQKYLALDEDYRIIESKLMKIPILKAAYEFSPGIRILRQDVWETLISFIISQNNNIKRIKGIINRLSKLAGTEICDGVYAFPKPDQLVKFDIEDLRSVGSGFRARYISSAARLVAEGVVDLPGIGLMSDEAARCVLTKISGVGPKVSACVLLYGLGRKAWAPVDVWMKRGLLKYLPDGWPAEVKGVEGVAQQYLYNYLRVGGDGS
ncbi:MAG: DNA-3-methyladenine glycosylase 2 family protein [Oscillospiraceae bacterium]|nr:DNA-3-methyladenine glycosylase 2 family protein [Oscillospiraceae bacterium]